MVQRPLKKVKIQKKPTKYKRILKNPKTLKDKITKELNKGIVERYETTYGSKRPTESDNEAEEK